MTLRGILEDNRPLLKTAYLLYQQGQFDEAKKQCEAILEQDSTCLEALHFLGVLFAQQGDYESAIGKFVTILSYDPADVIAHHHLANCYLHNSSAMSIKQALYHLEQAIHFKPDYAEAYNGLGNLYHQTNDLEKAKNYYQQAAELKPDYIDALMNLGTICLKQALLEEAKNYFERILLIFPTHSVAYFQLGNIAYQQKKLTEALRFYEQAPNHVNAQLNMGSIFLEQDSVEQAIEKFNYVLSLEPKHLFAHSNLAALYVTQKEYERALPHYYEILSQDPNHYTSHFNLAAIYMAQRKWETAAYHLAVAIRLKPDDPDAHDNYATTLLKLNRIDLAKEHYQQALRLRPGDEIASYRLAALTGNKLPDKAPAGYIQSLFDNYAENFDYELMDSLQYKVPEAISHQASLYLLDRVDLRILDLGCGTGLAGRYFVSKADYLIGVDLSANMLKIAEKKHIYDELVQDEMQHALTRWQAFFDLIIAADSFVYVGDLQALLLNAYHSLADGGCLIFTTEAGYEQNFQLTQTGRYLHHANYLNELANKIGFQVLELRRVKLREQKGVPVNGYLAVWKK